MLHPYLASISKSGEWSEMIFESGVVLRQEPPNVVDPHLTQHAIRNTKRGWRFEGKKEEY
jgi:hypothetical protein